MADVEKLASAELKDVLRGWAGLGYYARARNLHACAKIVAKRERRIPGTAEELTKLPGILRYTAAAVASIASNGAARRSMATSSGLSRVVRARRRASRCQAEAARLAESLLPSSRFGDFTQALMDLGATICTPKTPAGSLCPWSDVCVGRMRGDQETFPRKAPKREATLRRGAAFVALREDGYILLRRRPEKGLLGGMSEVPGSEWAADFDIAKARATGAQARQGRVAPARRCRRRCFHAFPAGVDGLRWSRSARHPCT